MIPVNPDHDNHIDILSFTHAYEIAFRSWNGIEFVDRPGWPKNFFPFMPTPPVVGDVDGDGQEEIIIGTYDPASVPSSGKLYVFALDGTEKLSLEVPGGLKHIPALVDVDGDGSFDVVYRALDGTVYVQNFGAHPGSLVSWATHRGNMRRDGNRGVSLFPNGTPLIIQRESGYRKTSFTWQPAAGNPPTSYRIFRADDPATSFQFVAEVSAQTTSFVDSGLKDGWQYLYEVRAVYPSGIVPSAPFALLSLFNNNLIANSGFEENDDSHWDKWFTGDIPWQNMVGCSAQPFQGKRCMEIQLVNSGDNSSVKQANQYGIPDPAVRTQSGKLYSFGCWFRSGGLSAPSEHWLEWNTTRTGDNTNDIPPAPWPVYFTPHFVLDTQPTPWTYCNRTFIMPNGFPNVELRHRFTVSGQVSGSVFLDNVYFRELPDLTDARWQDLVDFGSTWHYLASTPPDDWPAENFDDTAWPAAPAKFGGGTGVTGIVTALPLMQPAYYFRRQFSVPNDGLEEFLLSARATDDYNGKTYPLRVFLNGSEVISSGLDIVSGDGSSTHYADLLPFTNLVHPGTNTLGVIVQNGWASDWDNVAFDLNLKTILAPPTNAVCQFTSIYANPDGSVSLSLFGPPGTSWNLETSETPDSDAVWQPVQVIVIGSSRVAQETVPLPLATTRTTPTTSHYYRLRSP
jgi:hypothetical protein